MARVLCVLRFECLLPFQAEFMNSDCVKSTPVSRAINLLKVVLCGKFVSHRMVLGHTVAVLLLAATSIFFRTPDISVIAGTDNVQFNFAGSNL